VGNKDGKCLKKEFCRRLNGSNALLSCFISDRQCIALKSDTVFTENVEFVCKKSMRDESNLHKQIMML